MHMYVYAFINTKYIDTYYINKLLFWAITALLSTTQKSQSNVLSNFWFVSPPEAIRMG